MTPGPLTGKPVWWYNGQLGIVLGMEPPNLREPPRERQYRVYWFDTRNEILYLESSVEGYLNPKERQP